MKIPLLLAASTALAIAACATPTPYQAADHQARGFSEQQIEKNRFRVSFAGNSLTDLETVENYLLYRASELTIQRGYDHFILADKGTDKDKRYVGMHPRSRFGYSGHWGKGKQYFSPSYSWVYRYDPFYDDINIREYIRYEANAEIVMGLGSKPAQNERAYDAREVMRNLAGAISRPEG